MAVKLLFTPALALDIIMGKEPCPREVTYYPIRNIKRKPWDRVYYSEFWIHHMELRYNDIVMTEDPYWVTKLGGK
jgi:hypothetical protein